ncbi:MAG: hypothetical protein HY681_01640 [Chloroflexi bacterium]|nr:hypothetical protein [Chloroflexota bacterium]
MAVKRQVSTKLTLTPHQTEALQQAARLLGVDAKQLLDILISQIALPLAQAREAAIRASSGEGYHEEEAIPPYDWQPGELEEGKPIRYVPGKGFMVEE